MNYFSFSVFFSFTSNLVINLVLGLDVLDKPTFVDTYCTSSLYYNATHTQVEANLNLLLSYLTSNASSYGFYNSTAGYNTYQVYGLFLCRGDVAHKICQICVENASKEIRKRCAADQQAIIWYEECILWYSYRHWASSWWSPRAYKWEGEDIFDPNSFRQILSDLMDRLAAWATNSTSSSGILYFATGEASYSGFHKIFGLLQCIPDLSRSDCYSCLRNAIDQMSLQFNESSSGLGVYFLNCVARYSDRLFYNQSTASAPPLAEKRTSVSE